MSASGTLTIAVPWLIAVALFVAVIVTGAGALSDASLMDLSTLAFLDVTASWGLVLATVGALIAFRRPENRIGRLLQVSGPLVVSVFLGYLLAATPTTSPGTADPVPGIAGWWASTTIFLAIFLAFPVVGILYPDGRLPGRGWRLPILILVLIQLAMALMYAVKAGPVGPGLPDNPFGFVDVPPGERDLIGSLGTLSLVLAMALAVVAIAIRWRRGSLVDRSQLKWLFAALVVAGIMFPLAFGTSSQDESPGMIATLGVGSALLIPIAIGFAILRYRLYEIDRLVSRTIGYGLVTAVLAAVFLATNLGLQTMVAAATGGSTIAVAASTLLVAGLFQPLHRIVQAPVDRRFNRAQVDGGRALAAFADRVREEMDLANLSGAVLATADEAVRPTATRLWLRGRVQ
jgi:hypothetical protein